MIIFDWSAINPHDVLTWASEVFPVIIGVVILASTFHLFRFTTFAYLMIWIHSIILMIGAHYTYAEMPLFKIRDVFELSRNNYDKVGHFAQEFFPAIIAREILMKCESAVARSTKGPWSCVTLTMFLPEAIHLSEDTAVILGTGKSVFYKTMYLYRKLKGRGLAITITLCCFWAQAIN